MAYICLVIAHRRLLPLFFTAVVVFLLSAPASAAVTDEECLGCHDSLKNVSHGGVGCTDCHSSIADLPHPEKLPKPSCAACHDRTVAIYNGDIHKTKKIECVACHSAHFVQKDKKSCTTCHSNVSHAALPRKEQHLGNLPCVACHGKTDRIQLKVRVNLGSAGVSEAANIDEDRNGVVDEAEWRHLENPARGLSKGRSVVEKKYIATGGFHTITAKPVGCGQCHSTRGYLRDATLTVVGSKSHDVRLDPRIFVGVTPGEQEFGRTVHGKAGVTCGDCHGSAGRAVKPNVSGWAIDSSVCARCHGDVAQTYGNSQHAKMGAAVCIDCHNPHALRPYRELRAKERVAVCARCHNDYLKRHSWLPNTGLHFAYLECATCHSPKSQKSMVYFFAKKKGGEKTPFTYDQLARVTGPDPLAFVEARKSGPNDGYDAGIGSLFMDLRRRDKDTLIDASIIVTKVHHDYSETRIGEKECVTCHSREAGFYDSMLFLIPERDSVQYVPMKGTLFSSYPISTAVDFFLLGEDKLTKKDFSAFLSLRNGGHPLGFKLIDLFGLVALLLTLGAICIHIVLRIFLVKR